jgi:hypothetical protein
MRDAAMRGQATWPLRIVAFLDRPARSDGASMIACPRSASLDRHRPVQQRAKKVCTADLDAMMATNDEKDGRALLQAAHGRR